MVIAHRTTRSRRLAGLSIAVIVLNLILGAAPVAVAAPPDATPSAREMEFRSTFGLSTDVARVARETATEAISPNWGVRLTKDEEANLAARVVVTDQLPAVRDALAADVGFGGLYFDQAAGGVVDVGATADRVESIRAATAALAPAGAQVRVRVVSQTFDALKALKDAISDEMSAGTPLARGVYVVGVDIPRNVVRVSVDRSAFGDVVRRLRGRFGDAPLAFEPADPPVAAACVSRDNCSPPMRAGVKITDPGGCTSNFIATAGAINYLMTAGHCGAEGNVFKHNGNTIGTADKTAFKNGGFADALRIKLNNANLKSNLMYITQPVQRPVTSRMALNGDVVGSSVCQSGISTGFICGAVTDVDQDALYPGSIVIKHMQICNLDVRLGDSGGPVFYGNKAMGVVGLVNGTHHDPPDEYWENLMFSQVRDMEIQLGVTVFTG